MAMMPPWTEEELDILKREWPLGKSGSEIGILIGKSRNSVIGKIHRLGLHVRALGRNNKGNRIPKKLKERKEAKAAKEAKEVVKSKVMPPRFLPTALPLANRLPISMDQLNYFTCRAIVGKDERGVAVYCGDMIFPGKPFCEGHCAMYYQPLNARRA